MTEKELKHEAMILGRIARVHFLKGRTEQEAEADIYEELVKIIEKAKAPNADLTGSFQPGKGQDGNDKRGG